MKTDENPLVRLLELLDVKNEGDPEIIAELYRLADLVLTSSQQLPLAAAPVELLVLDNMEN